MLALLVAVVPLLVAGAVLAQGITCGPGTDTVSFDPGDKIEKCERTNPGV